MPEAQTCLGFTVDCATLWKGVGVSVAALVLFVGSVYVLLAAVFGRWMGYLVLVVALSGWLIIQSSLWLFGFWSQGPETPTNLGPRGSDPAWLVVGAGLQPGDHFQQFRSYPGDPWIVPTGATADEAADIQSVNATATTYLAEQANAELGKDPLAVDAVQATQFTVDSITFATAEDGHTPLAVVKAHFTGGGPETTLSMYYDSGSIPRYSIMFLGGSILLFLIHLPLLDRAERQRKAFLTGGSAPAWYGPA